MNLQELYNLVEDYYGYKARMRYINTKTMEVACILYDSFWMRCGLDERYGFFGAGIEVGKEGLITDLLGEETTLMSADPESIKKGLKVIDDYCRMRLPDKFLDAYYKAYFLSQYEDCDL